MFHQGEVRNEPHRACRPPDPIQVVVNNFEVDKLKADLEKAEDTIRKLNALIIEMDKDVKFFQNELLERNNLIEKYISLEERKRLAEPEPDAKLVELENKLKTLSTPKKKEVKTLPRGKSVKPRWS